MSTSAHRSPRALGRDPLPLVVAAVALAVYALHGFGSYLSRDLSLYSYAGQQVADGVPPYVGALNRAGPLAHLLPGVGVMAARLVGMDDLLGMRLFFMLLAVCCTAVVYLLGRDLFGSRTVGLVTAAAFLTFTGFIEYASNGPREKTPMVLCLLAVFLAVRHRRWATAGVFVALATLIWQPVFFVAVVTAVVGGLLAPRHRLRALLRIAVGGIVPTALVLIYYAANGALQTFADAFFLINAEYTSQPGVLANVPANWASLRSGYGPSLVLILLGLAAVPLPAVRWARVAWRHRDVHAATYVALGAGWLAGLIWCAVAFNGWPDLFVMLPIAAIGVGWAAGVVLRRLRVRAAVAAALALALAGTAYATVFSVDSRVDDLGKQEASIAGVFAAGPADATVLSMEAPQVLVLTGRTNPTQYQMFDHGFSNYLAATYPGGLGGFLAWIQRTHPTYIVTKTNLVQPWFQPWLEENYVHVGNTRRFRWWVTDTVTKDVRKQIRAAAQTAQEASS